MRSWCWYAHDLSQPRLMQEALLPRSNHQRPVTLSCYKGPLGTSVCNDAGVWRERGRVQAACEGWPKAPAGFSRGGCRGPSRVHSGVREALQRGCLLQRPWKGTCSTYIPNFASCHVVIVSGPHVRALANTEAAT